MRSSPLFRHVPEAHLAKRTEDFWKKVDKAGPLPEQRPDLGPCWVWTGNLFPNGYGKFGVYYRHVLTHRFSYTLLVGEIPKGLVLDHLCRNRACLNPSHLEPKTQRENTLATNSQCMAALRAARTHCPRGHPYSTENTYRYKTKRGCRSCRRQQFIRFMNRKTYGSFHSK